MSDISNNKRKNTKLSPQQTVALLTYFAQTPNPEKLAFKKYYDTQ